MATQIELGFRQKRDSFARCCVFAADLPARSYRGSGIQRPEDGRLGIARRSRKMGHSRPDTTQACTDEVDLEEFAAALDRAPWNRHAQASSGWATDRPTTRRKPLEWRPRESSPQALDRPTAWASTAELAQPGGHGDFLPESLPASLHTPLNRAAACSAGHRVRIRKPLPHPGLRSIAEADAVCMASETASESRRGWPPVFSDGVPRQAP